MKRVNVIPKPQRVVVLSSDADKRVLETLKETVDSSMEKNGAYKLCVETDSVTVTAADEQGFFYARQTLRQLFASGKSPCLLIEDKPEYLYRGVHLDSVRHMQSVDEIKRYIDAAALMKFNVFHWHLSDDQGFRIECNSFPLLNEKASFRDSSDFGELHVAERYGGFYTKAQIREIVDYCAERQIEVIPEIDMPGHTISLISAYPRLSCKKLQIPVETHQGIFDDILCAGDEYVYEFIFRLLDEIVELFPSKRFHIGGDEAPKRRWKQCPKCRAAMQENLLHNAEELQGLFTNRIIEHLKSLGKEALVWNESLESGLLDSSATVQMWMDKSGKSAVWLNRGGSVISSDFYHYYCDYPYAMTPLKKAYEWNPVPQGTAAVMERHLLGVEGALWTEYVDNFDRLCFLAYPRFAAIAENGWCSRKLLNYEDFLRRLDSVLPLFEELGVKPAPKPEWDPDLLNRAKNTVGFFKGKIVWSNIIDNFKKEK